MNPLRFRQVPLLAAVVCFACGIAARRLAPPASRPVILLLLATLLLAALTALALRRTLRLALLPVAALWFTAGVWCAQIEPYPPPQAALASYADGLSRTMQGRILRIRELAPSPTTDSTRAQSGLTPDFDPDQWDQPGQARYSVDLALTSIEDVTPDTSRMVPISGNIRATLRSTDLPALASQLRCGDRISAPVRLRLPPRYRDPGVFQYADYLLRDDPSAIVATTSIPAEKLRILHGALSPRDDAALRCVLSAAQLWAADRLLAYGGSGVNRRMPALLRLSPDDVATLNAMLFGDRTRLTRQLRLGFERTGSFHLFVVSGMHVALLAVALFWIARRFRLPPGYATTLTLALTLAYALLTGFGVPVRRALFMTAVLLAARLVFRERLALNALGAAALAILVASPRALFETSFQMTFLALVAIAGIAAPVTERTLVPWSYAAKGLYVRWKDTTLPPRLAQLRVMLRLWGRLLGAVLGRRARVLPALLLRIVLWTAELALVGLAAEAVMALPMALYFHRTTLFALPVNMLSIPLVGIIAVLGGFTFCLALVSPWLAAAPAAGTAALLHAISGAIRLLLRLHAADMRLPGPRLVPALAAFVCIALCCWAARHSSRLAPLAAAALLSCSVFLVVWQHPPLLYPGTLEVTALDVGQGDSILVVGPEGHTMLIDAGGPTGAAAHAENAENASGAASFDTGEQVVSPYLWSRQIRSLDVVVLSHAHSDHMGGMPAVLRNFRPRELWVGVDPASPGYRALLDEAGTLGIVVRHLRAPDTLAWDGTMISVLAPAPAYRNPGPPVNDDSLVLRLRFGRASALLEGDAEAPSERSMLKASADGGPQIGPDTLLKVGHHGSRSSTTPDFLAAVAPREAVISVGLGNTFGHPRSEILARLAQAHAHVFRTDEFGLSTFLLSPDASISEIPIASNP